MIVTPAMCFVFMKVRVRTSASNGDGDAYDGRFYRAYRTVLAAALGQRFAVLAFVAVAGFAVFLMTWDIPPPTATVEILIPDDRFAK